MERRVSFDSRQQVKERILSAARSGLVFPPSSNPAAGALIASRRLHVLTLTPFYPSVEDSAEGSFVAEPLLWTEQLGIRNSVIAAQPFYRALRHANEGGIPCSWKRYLALPGRFGLPTAAGGVARALRRNVHEMHRSRPIDLIHAHAALPCGYAAAKLAHELGVPFVVSVHGLDAFYTRQLGAALATWSRRLCAHIYRRARTVICISEKVREAVRRHATVNTVVVHNGVDAGLFSPAPESRSPLIILSVGNLIPTKGHELLLRAFAEVLRRFSNTRLEIIGDGPERERLNWLTEKLGISANVLFLGRQSRHAVAQAMKRSAVFALPSSYEGLGCVYLEAMASGKPVVACSQQGIEDIIEHGKNGILINPGDDRQLANALLTLLVNDADRHELGTSARKTVVETYTLGQQAQRLWHIYSECAQ